MKVVPTTLPDVSIIEPEVFTDPRGYLFEAFHAARFQAHDLPASFAQDNISFSHQGVLRGLHLQHPQPQGKLVFVLEGEVFDVAVDVRLGSPTFGRWTGTPLSAANRRQMYIPPGLAHGYCVLSEHAILAYKCTCPYQPDAAFALAWDDPDLAIDWPLRRPLLSPTDAAAPRLRQIDPERLPRFGT